MSGPTDSLKTVTKSERNELLAYWIKPSSDTEKSQQERAERMIRDAIAASDIPASAEYIVYTKGSYRNSTNVRSDSDVDVVAELIECNYYDYWNCEAPTPKLTPYSGEWRPSTWRSAVEKAMVDYYGAAAVDLSGNIAINLPEVKGSRPSADVVPAFDYRRYDASDRSVSHVGSCVFPKDGGKKIVNWPDQQYKNGVTKNDATGRRYKRFVRALKRSENWLVAEEGMAPLASYLMECLVYNVPDHILSFGDLEEGFGATLDYLANRLRNDHETMEEPNGLKWLFRGNKKWTAAECQQLIDSTKKAFGFGDS